MNRVKITHVKIGTLDKLEDYKFSVHSEGHEEKPEDNLEFNISPNRLIRLQARSKTNELYETQPFDSNFVATNSSLSVPVYKLSRPGRLQGKIQISLVNFSGLNTCCASEVSETGSFGGVSKGSTPSFDDNPTNKSAVLQICEGINSELRSSVVKLRKMLEIEKAAKDQLVKDVQRVKNEVGVERDEHKKREKFLLAELQLTETNFSNLKFDLLKTKTENKALIAENSRITSMLQEKETTNGSFATELSTYSEHFSPVLHALHKISEFNQKDANTELDQKNLLIQSLTRELNELKIINKSMQVNRQIIKTCDLDEILAQKLKNLKISGAFTKDPEQSYVYSGKKIILTLKSGQLLCKFGSVYKTFEEYMRSLGVTSRSASHKRIRSLDIGVEFKSTNPQMSRTKVKTPVNNP